MESESATTHSPRQMMCHVGGRTWLLAGARCGAVFTLCRPGRPRPRAHTLQHGMPTVRIAVPQSADTRTEFGVLSVKTARYESAGFGEVLVAALPATSPQSVDSLTEACTGGATTRSNAGGRPARTSPHAPALRVLGRAVDRAWIACPRGSQTRAMNSMGALCPSTDPNRALITSLLGTAHGE